MKGTRESIHNAKDDDDSSDEEPTHVDRHNPAAVLEEKNRILMDRLFKSEK